MNKRASSLATVLLAGTCLLGTATAATASGDGGDGNTKLTAIAVSNGSGQANATVNGAGQPGSTNPTPPVIGDPSTGTLQYGTTVDATIASVNVSMSYSCPTGSPSDSRIDVVVGQDNGSQGVAGTTVTCDGTVRTLQLNVAAATTTLYVPGRTIVTIQLYSPSDPNALFVHFDTTVNI
ncbi:hypothetical protein EES43_27615 [Streptomyces sp. ADI96-02]|uniref:hypothetical protein n=1 Tax=unclassified Streptomyces TaxID=2593676 RepID=UPI000F552CC6|nr:hypothetical protein [Streptomyces sp. ADI96-02]RPK54837.1 hypothetical protein EES43_27615 [Streptomyces sp. ADI96-02]